MEKSKGSQYTARSRDGTGQPKLSDLGLTKNESARWQASARVIAFGDAGVSIEHAPDSHDDGSMALFGGCRVHWQASGRIDAMCHNQTVWNS
jgi:hypothetical protein